MRSGFWVDWGDRIFGLMGDRVFCGGGIGVFCGWGRSGYNKENLTTKMTVMRELIQQELEKFDREQLQQVFEFISFLKFRARLVTIPAIDETNLAALYSEFAEEDRQLAELGISEYSELLKHEDLA
ncbi:MAG: hypothetical protein WCF82_19405 [Microcoleus sp.]